MTDRTKPSAPSASLSYRQRLPWAAAALICLALAARAGDPPSSIVESIEFDEAFRSYYDALADHTPEDLRLELSETIEDALSSGSHLTRASLDYKTRQIEAGLFAHLRQQQCAASTPPAKEQSKLKHVAVRTLTDAGEDAEIRFDREELGMISGILVRLLEIMPRNQLCDGQ
ncbi:MAG: hypothetical protein U9Q81_03935 [Pseudomonadota bacterium]|nr:hypothetical protein [Pseudomonadota bacterium]